MRRLGGWPDIVQKSDSTRHNVHIRCTECPRICRQRRRGNDDRAGTPNQRAERPRDPSRQLGIAPPQLHHHGLASCERRERRWQPMRVDEVCIPRRAARSGSERDQKERNRQDKPRAPTNVVRDPVAVGEAVVTEHDR